MVIGPILFLLAILAYFLYILHYAYSLYFAKIEPLTLSEKKIILNNFPVYKKLSIRQKQKFEYRLLRFRKDKQFVFNGEIPRHDDMALLLSATATMLTLGLKNYKIPAIERIIIYPDQYYSKITRQDHIGEYNPGLKTIVVSALHVKQGFQIPNDNKNLGVHEFAHALSFNSIIEDSREARFFKKQIDKVNHMFDSSTFNEKLENSNYFRAYSRTNMHEFFAVATENYVETPEQFKIEFPVLYALIGSMLKFDFHQPVNRT
ncbi:zinc-dependent peptidase [Cellulophaga baltica]|uniref:zinc-dependent peptidase n=1 Tax=Cellulophaga TaxID=104264 RepID=UPI001C07B9A3|nr:MULTISPECIES: zinc-dependent peptidase [Cellulophaga]MBU2997027.1 zinc-dependent peptidase [Cellulophaga baltica]MDO6768425.1 zinc-dependent peptidase [Cellulophaga sp. 1_MG-2023]